MRQNKKADTRQFCVRLLLFYRFIRRADILLYKRNLRAGANRQHAEVLLFRIIQFYQTAAQIKRFRRSHDFVGNAHNHAFAVFRRSDIQRKHMLPYNILLNLAEHEITPRIYKRAPRVVKTVFSVLFALDVPVVQKIIVQQRTANHRAFVRTDIHSPHDVQAQVRHIQRMFVHARVPVLHEGFFRLYLLGGQNIPAVVINTFAYRFTHNLTLSRLPAYSYCTTCRENMQQ